MDHHSWRPHPIQGNICPTCSISHFPFCPPRPPPYPGPGFDPNPGPMARPAYHDPGYWPRNPSNLPQMGDFGNVNRGPYSMQNHGFCDNAYVGSNDYNSTFNNNNMDDRSSKRLRVDGVGPGLSYGGEGDGGLSGVVPVENDRRLRLVRDHGGPGFGPGSGFVQESSGFGRNVDAREVGSSVNMGMRSNVGGGYGVSYRSREDLGYQSGYGSHLGVKRSAPDLEHGPMGNRFESNDHQLPPYGQVAKPPDYGGFNQGVVGHDKDVGSHGFHRSSYGTSHVPNESFYGANATVPYEQRSNMPVSSQYSGNRPPFPNTMQQPGEVRYDYHPSSQFNDVRQQHEARTGPVEGYQGPPSRPHYGPPHMDTRGGYGNSVSENMSHLGASQGFDVRPPLPPSPPPPPPPPPLHKEPLSQWSADQKPSSLHPKVSSSLFPIHTSTSAGVHSSYAPVAPESQTRTHPHLQNPQLQHPSRGPFQGDAQATLTSSGHYLGDGQPLSSKKNVPDISKVIDASHLFKPPHRATRPDHFVIILRGLPGSGKSYLAKMLRDLEVEHGGNAPRIHSMDDYFMTEVEKAEDNETSKSFMRGKKPTMKTVLEYCYEPEMEEAYRASMLKAFKKTLEEGVFTLVIVDDRNLRVADFAQFWATAKRSGYEVYVLEAPYKDPTGCTARNVHGFTQDDVGKMAAQWEDAPPLYLQLNAKSLFHGDDLTEGNIQEVDMDTEDGDFDGGLPRMDEREPEKIAASSASLKDERSSNADDDNPTEEVKGLGRSKWSDIFDEEHDEITDASKGKPNVLSGLLKTYGKGGKSVHWGDKGGDTGFSIGAVKKANVVSLVIGPGPGYNLKSNPLPVEETRVAAKSGGTKKHSVFKERLRAEQESFKAVFDRRRHRIGGLDVEDE